MQAQALAVYEHALVSAGELTMSTADGRSLDMDVARWLGAPDAADRSVLDRCRGASLDVGCGPGRFVIALARRGHLVLGVDIAHAAIDISLRGGGLALRRDVFATLPLEGRWDTVLLMDGNVGINGDPGRLLRRLRDVLAPDGQLLIETAPDLEGMEQFTARLHGRAGAGERFAWARVGTAAAVMLAQETGYSSADSWRVDGRAFVAVSR
ncbi:MAG: class I SAM-dependent methyltransferase [Jatrophihabitans sp.]|uniref:class I SAM-dependent methyltransferase n=1 Tax=Jatrophihabitans sp. TaxID=1932789 RepID=UPI003F80E535